MPDAIFAHPRLAGVYDAFDADRGDLAAYLAIADEVSAGHVLDVRSVVPGRSGRATSNR
ncbi:hypothetical protein MXD63_11880 [Frankia sp. Cpl3]|nr:hypothetical protein [Parafrankia colletiae]MCK9900777.1 hypothetical protein [Frankia sp. Cpl3]